MSVPLSVLIVEDDPNDAELVLDALRAHGFEPEYERVEDVTALRHALENRPWQVVISDYSIRQFDGRAALAVFKESGQDIPFICVSGTIGEDLAVGMMKAGAHDYVLKDRLARLGPAINRELHAADERRRAKQSETQVTHLAAIVEGSHDAIISKDLGGTILSWNRGAERVFGYTAAEIVGQSISLTIPQDRQPELSDIFKKIIRGQLIERFETVRLTRTGRLVDVSLTISPVRNEHRQVVGASTIARDITDRKQQESERIKLIEELQAAVTRVKTLNGLLPICAWCKKIRDDQGYWQQVETYIKLHAPVDFTHAICPDCTHKMHPETSVAGRSRV